MPQRRVPLNQETWNQYLRDHPEVDYLLDHQSFNRPDLAKRVQDILSGAAETYFDLSL